MQSGTISCCGAIFQSPELYHVTPTLSRVICHLYARNCRHQRLCQIWSFYLHP